MNIPRFNTPLRYPGGKQTLTPFIMELLKANNLKGCDYAEPYAGGAGVAIELILRGEVQRIHLNDRCRGIYLFWRSVLQNTDALCKKIVDVNLSVKEWRRQQEIMKRPTEFGDIDVAFSLLFLNRCNRSGIISGGLIGGIRQNGKWKMDARFTRMTRIEIVRRIHAIAAKANAITIHNWDAEKFLRNYVSKLEVKCLAYCDPPYYHKGEKLYLNIYSPKDHARLASTIQSEVSQPWIVSYDCAGEIVKEYAARQCFVYDLQYHAGNRDKGKEVFFFSDCIQLPNRSKVSAINNALQERDALCI